MDQVTQQNAALVEQAAAAAGSLQDQAARLAQVVSVFKLDANGVAVAPSYIAPRANSGAATRSPLRNVSPQRPAAITRASKEPATRLIPPHSQPENQSMTARKIGKHSDDQSRSQTMTK